MVTNRVVCEVKSRSSAINESMLFNSIEDMRDLLFGRKMVDGAKIDGELNAEVPYKSMGSECGLSNNSPLKLRTGHLVFHTLL